MDDEVPANLLVHVTTYNLTINQNQYPEHISSCFFEILKYSFPKNRGKMSPHHCVHIVKSHF